MGIFSRREKVDPNPRPEDDELDERAKSVARELKHTASNAEQLIAALLEQRKPRARGAHQ